MSDPLTSIREVRAESPLNYYVGRAETNVISADRKQSITIRELPLYSYFNLRGNPEDQEFVESIRLTLGLDLPLEPGACSQKDGLRMYWLGPTEWLLINSSGLEADLEAELRSRLRGVFSLVDVSGGHTSVRLTGQGVLTLLKKSSSYDFHPDNFAKGKCVQTTFAKATALVINRDEDCFELVVRRSFADYILKWIVDAASEFGVRFLSGEE